MKKIHKLSFLLSIIFVLSFFNLKISAQNFENYTNIKSSGKIPADFLGLSSSKFKADKTTISKDEESQLKRSKKKFYLGNNFLVDELLHNGKVLYNDPIGIYINKVLDNVLEHKPELKKQIRVYVVLSDIVNAYATNNGIIFINVGLLAKLENEAQLAFILGHEVTHYEKSHVLNRFVLKEQIERKKVRINYSDSDAESILFSNTSYAKEQEIESDIESTKLLLGTRYNPSSGMEVMKILASDIPMKSRYTFHPSFFSKDTLLHVNLKKISIDSLEYKEDLESESKTHPALSQRIKTISGLFDTINHNQNNFILPQEEFNKIQQIAQFEVSKIFLKKGNYLYALYCLYELLQKDPSNIYLNDLLCKTFYLASKYRGLSTYDNLNITTSNTPKEIQLIYEYINQLSNSEINALSIYFYIKTNQEKEIIANEIRLRDLLYDFKYTYQNEDHLESIPNIRSIILAIPSIQEYLNTIHQDATNSIVISKDGFVSTNKKKTKAVFPKIDNIIILDPVYKKFDLRRKTEEKFIASEKSLLAYNEQIQLISDQLKIKDTIVSSIGWTENDTISFNHHSLFKGHVEEIMNNGSQIISTDFELVDGTCNASYHSNHLALMGTYSLHIQKSPVLKIIVLVWSAILFPAFPIGVYYVATPSYKTYTYLVTLNTTNQSFDYKNVRMLRFRDSKGAINSSTYYQLLKMKKGK